MKACHINVTARALSLPALESTIWNKLLVATFFLSFPAPVDDGGIVESYRGFAGFNWTGHKHAGAGLLLNPIAGPEDVTWSDDSIG